MGKIGDLWVRLGLKNDEFKKGIAEAKTDTKDFGGILDKFKVGAVAVWTAVGAAVAKFAKDAVALTQKFGDEWNNTMNGVRGAYQSFVRQISSGEGWSNLLANMAEAYRVSKELSAAMDELFERKTSFLYDEAQTRLAVSEQQKIMRDSSKSDAERKAAAKEIIRLEEDLANRKKTIYEDEAKYARREMELQTGLHDTEIDFLVKEYNKNRDIINQSREYLAERKKLEQQRKGGVYAGASDALYGFNTAGEAVNKLEELEKNTPEMIRRVAALTQMYDKGYDALVKAVADADIAVINIKTEANQRAMRATATLGALTKATQESGNAAKEAADDYKELAEAIDRSGYQIQDVKNPLGRKWQYDNFLHEDEWLAGKQGANPFQSYIDQLNVAQVATEDMMHAIEDGLVGAFDELANAVAGVGDADFGSVMKALLTPLADTAIKAGTIIMTTGTALDALKKAFSNLFGGGAQGAIIGGALLAGLGVAAKAGLAAIGNGGSAPSATTAMSGGGNGYTDFGSVRSQELTINVKGTIKGSDILISGSNQQSEWNK